MFVLPKSKIENRSKQRCRNWGVYFNIFPNFLAISESGRCNKKPTNWPIFGCDISIFECKV